MNFVICKFFLGNVFLVYSIILLYFSVKFSMHDAEKLCGLTLYMHESVQKLSILIQWFACNRCKLNFFQQCLLPTFLSQQWLSQFFLGEQVQIDQTSLFLVLSTDAFRKMQNVKFLQLNYTSSTEVMNTFPRI